MKFKKFLFVIFPITLFIGCAVKHPVSIKKELSGIPEEPSLEFAHLQLQDVALKACPNGFSFDDGSITFGASIDGRPASVEMNIYCK